MKNGFVLMTFLVYFGLYTFSCGIILYFCTFFIQIIQATQTKSRALYAYHSIQKRFVDDCTFCLDIQVEDKNIKITVEEGVIIWKEQGHFLVRKEYKRQEKNVKKTIIYFCTIADHLIPFIYTQNNTCLYVGFTVDLFSLPFTIATIVPKRESHEAA